MIDELDLAFDEQAERGKPRHRRGARGSKGKGGRTVVAFLMVFILLGVLGVGGYLGYEKIKGFFTAADYDGAGADPVQVSVPKNATLTEIGNVLVDADVVKSTAAFTEAAAENPKGKNIQSGTYNLRKQMAAKEAVTLLLDPKARVTNGVTIFEGKTARQIYDILAKSTGIPVKDFQEAAKDPAALGVPDFWYHRRDGKKAATTSHRGLPLPGTMYQFPPGFTAVRVPRNRWSSSSWASRPSSTSSRRWRTTSRCQPVRGVDRGVAERRPRRASRRTCRKIARVAYNRAYKAKMPLQFDVTTSVLARNLQDKSGKHSGKMTDALLAGSEESVHRRS